jgi:methylenetetrahydrofolate reductase (NADH)
MSPVPRSRLRARLESGGFAVTAEIGPPRGADAEAVGVKARLLRGWVDAVNITDNQGSHVRLSSWAGSLAALAAGVEPVMQLTCRDRNRIALQSDLLSASAMGIPNVLLLTGDHPKFGDHAEAKPVFDLDSVQLLWTARTMRDDGQLLSGRTLDPPPAWFIGAVENPFAPPERFRASRLGKKIAAGAEFVQTQFVFDVPAFARWVAEAGDLGLRERCHILAGVGPIRSLRALDHMRGNVPGVYVPDEIDRRLRLVPADRVAEEGMLVAAEIIQQVRELDGVAGVHVMAFGHEHAIPPVLERAGLARRPALKVAADGAEGAAAGAGGSASTASSAGPASSLGSASSGSCHAP